MNIVAMPMMATLAMMLLTMNMAVMAVLAKIPNFKSQYSRY